MLCGPDACGVGQYKDPEQCCKDCAELCDPGRDQEEECLWSCGSEYLNPAITEPSELIANAAQDPEAESDPMLNTVLAIVTCLVGAVFLVTVLIIGYIVCRSRTRQTDQENVVEEEEEEAPLKPSIEETEQPDPAALRAHNYALIAQPEGSWQAAG